MNEAADSLAAFLLRARDVYGVNVNYLSINEANGGFNLLMNEPEMDQFIKVTGVRFAQLGLTTKWLVGDTYSVDTLVNYAKPILDDPDAAPYLGPISYHTWWSETEPDSVYTAIRDLGKQYNKPIW